MIDLLLIIRGAGMREVRVHLVVGSYHIGYCATPPNPKLFILVLAIVFKRWPWFESPINGPQIEEETMVGCDISVYCGMRPLSGTPT